MWHYFGKSHGQKLLIPEVLKLEIFILILPEYSPYSVRLRENADQNNSEYGHLIRSDRDKKTLKFRQFYPRNGYCL